MRFTMPCGKAWNNWWRGEFTEYDDESLGELFDGLKQRVTNRAIYDELRP